MSKAIEANLFLTDGENWVKEQERLRKNKNRAEDEPRIKRTHEDFVKLRKWPSKFKKLKMPSHTRAEVATLYETLKGQKVEEEFVDHYIQYTKSKDLFIWITVQEGNHSFDEVTIDEEKRAKLKHMAEYLAIANFNEIRWHQKGSVLVTFSYQGSADELEI